jgi:Lactonase, 7-bladed beta-propeller
MLPKIGWSKGGNKKVYWGAIASGLLAVCFGLASARPSLAQSKIYVESNDPAGNAVLAYQSDSSGNLTKIGSYSTGGDGLYTLQFGPYDNDGPIIVNSNHSLLFAVDGGTNDVAVFHINGDGSLTPVDGSPFASGGVFPVGLALSGNTLIVVNKSKQEPTTPAPFGGAPQALPNYSTFTVNNNGSLTPVSTLEVGYDNSPSQALAARQGGMVFGDDFVGGLLRTFKVTPSGQIVPLFTFGLPASEYAAGAPHWPLGMAADGFNKLLYVGFPTASKLGVFSYDAAGHLTFLRTAANSGKAMCWLASDPAGPYLYTTNNIDASVSTYDLTDPTTPTETQHLVLTLPTTSSPFQLQVDPSGKFLYIVGQSITTVAAPPADAGATAGGNVIHVLSINSSTGALTEVGTSPVGLGTPDASRAQGMVVF